MKKVLVTGAAGQIATRLRPLLRGIYPELRLSDIRPPDDLGHDETFVKADLARMDEVERAVQGVDGIIHLGGIASEAPWQDILDANIAGCYNLFEAARLAGVERIVFASSNHAIGFYPCQRRIGPDVTVRPDSRYGVSKAFGEALGALYAFKHGLRVTCLRIGNAGNAPRSVRELSIWIAMEDLTQLVRIGLEHPDIRYEIFYGVSDNARSYWNNGIALQYGYRAGHRAEDHGAEALAGEARLAPDAVREWYQGGSFCSDEFTDGIERSQS